MDAVQQRSAALGEVAEDVLFSGEAAEAIVARIASYADGRLSATAFSKREQAMPDKNLHHQNIPARRQRAAAIISECLNRAGVAVRMPEEEISVDAPE